MSPLSPIATYQPGSSTGSPLVHSFFDNSTSTWTYLVVDPQSRKALIIDPVLDLDPASGAVSTLSARGLLEFVNQEQYDVVQIMETHVHADHATSAYTLKQVSLSRNETRRNCGS
jgi:glyoxylase-like metal-dependent hydrolase (beta-lactamase superfamily II)